MSDDLTAAGAALLEWLGGCANYTRSDCRGNGRGPRDSKYGAERWCEPCEVRDRLPAIERQAAARAVDEALSVERVADAIRRSAMEPGGKVGYHHHPEEEAAALVAHLRGPRP